ncbi:hypothetical protein J2Z31_002757 [Sinorhizobium kostiense]|uniref:Response regulatory domain-containing protein n=1 Tax=Sinorhizobium kostiense TaxID=76747 RepID=A0ABS4R033_9HYPH|nr:hypothetical protein [Sinorhizobium kostiense]
MTDSHATVLVVDDQVRHAGLAAILKGIRRTVGTAARQKAPATVDVIHALIARIDQRRSRASVTGLCCYSASLAPSAAPNSSRSPSRTSNKSVDVFLPKSNRIRRRKVSRWPC